MGLKERIEKLQHSLEKLHCDAFLVEDTTNLFYLTGLDVSMGKLLLTEKEAFFFVDNRYYEMVKKRSPVTVLLLEGNAFIDHFKMAVPESVCHLGFDSETTSYASYKQLQEMVEKIGNGLKLVPVKDPVKNLRAHKEPEEIMILREAAVLGSEGYDYLLTLLKEGVSEVEMAVELEIFWKRRGSKALAFDPIISFGANSSMPHYRVGNTKLSKGDTILLDIGVNDRHYHSDMTRVVFFEEPNPKIVAIYEVVLKAQLAALEKCCPGTSIGELDATARDIIESAGYGDKFTHSLGHGVGLDIHELPTIRNKPPYNGAKLEVGMVITVEPGIYLQGIGGVRIEDTVVITEEGHENLTNRSKDLQIIKGS